MLKFTLLLLAFFLPHPQQLWPQASLGENLETLTVLIDRSLETVNGMESGNESLKAALENLEVSLKTQSLLLRQQGELLNEQEAGYQRLQGIYERQGKYLDTLQFRSKIWKWSLIIAVPACTGLGIWLGASMLR